MEKINLKLLISIIALFVELYIIVTFQEEDLVSLITLVAIILTSFMLGKYRQIKIDSYSPNLNVGEKGENDGEIGT